MLVHVPQLFLSSQRANHEILYCYLNHLLKLQFVYSTEKVFWSQYHNIVYTTIKSAETKQKFAIAKILPSKSTSLFQAAVILRNLFFLLLATSRNMFFLFSTIQMLNSL